MKLFSSLLESYRSKRIYLTIRNWIVEYFAKISADTLGWVAIMAIHASTIPSLLALLTGLSDRTPGLDMILLMWLGLVLLFGRAVILKDMLNIITISLGFIVQAVIMALILFK